MTNLYRIDRTATAPDANLLPRVAIGLALGCSLPETVDAWPVGLVTAWNDAADAGAFAGCSTLGDMARAFLAERMKRMTEAGQ